MALGLGKHNIRLRVMGYKGVGDSAQALSLTSQAMWNRLARRPDAITNVRRYRDKKQALTGEGKPKGDNDNEYSIKQPAIGLIYTNKYTDAYNVRTAWTTTPSAQSTYLTDAALRFRGTTKALYFDNAQPTNPVAFQSTGFTINESGAFALQIFIFEPDSVSGKDVKAWMWGTQGSLGTPEWRFEIRNGNISLMRLTASWSSANQAFYDALLNTEGALSDTAQAQKNTLEQTIYAQTESLSLGLGSKSVYGQPLEFTFRPEPRGLYEITNEGSDAGANGTERFDTVENTAITRTRREGVMFKSSLMTVTSSGGSFMWQVGFPEYARSGRLALPPWTTDTIIPVEDRVFAMNASIPSGCTLALSLIEPTASTYQIVADFTSDTHRTPLLYTASFTAQGGERDGSLATFWDSLDFETPYKSLVMDATFQHEGSGKPTTCSITLDNSRGEVAGPSDSGTDSILTGWEPNLDAFHDRMCDIWADDMAPDGSVAETLLIMANGIITKAQPGNMTEVVQNERMELVTQTKATVELEISDQQVLLDEDLMTSDELIGDGVDLGLHAYRHLQNYGARADELGSLSTSTGVILPTAAPGESPVIKASGGSRGGHLHPLFERYGMGRTLDHVAGLWVINAPNPAVLPLVFSTNPGANEYPIFRDLDYLRDYSDFFNDFYVEGVEQWDGTRARVQWRDYPSINDHNSLNYIGRVKAYPDEQSDEARTEDDCWRVIRSLATKYNRSGRFFSFSTVFIKELLVVNSPRVLIHSATYGDMTCDIVRMGDSSLKSNEMKLTIREAI